MEKSTLQPLRLPWSCTAAHRARVNHDQQPMTEAVPNRNQERNITVIQQLFNQHLLAGAFVNIDAMGTQKEIVQKIVQLAGDYILTIKGNQEALLEDILMRCHSTRLEAESDDPDKGHEQIKERRCQVFAPSTSCYLTPNGRHFRAPSRTLPGARHADRARANVHQIVAHEQPFNGYIRSHWEVENKLHRTLDTILGEKHQRKRWRMVSQNFSIAIKFALNFLKTNGIEVFPKSADNLTR